MVFDIFTIADRFARDWGRITQRDWGRIAQRRRDRNIPHEDNPRCQSHKLVLLY